MAQLRKVVITPDRRKTRGNRWALEEGIHDIEQEFFASIRRRDNEATYHIVLTIEDAK